MATPTLTPGLSADEAAALITWTNARDARYLRLWAGPEAVFPLTADAFNGLGDGLYAIRWEGRFAGIIQRIRRQGDTVHMGRFVLNPALTGRGIGRQALSAFIRLMFEECAVETITLHVAADNSAARHLYETTGFEMVGREGSRYLLRLPREHWEKNKTR